jgi:hypothetical protein
MVGVHFQPSESRYGRDNLLEDDVPGRRAAAPAPALYLASDTVSMLACVLAIARPQRVVIFAVWLAGRDGDGASYAIASFAFESGGSPATVIISPRAPSAGWCCCRLLFGFNSNI